MNTAKNSLRMDLADGRNGDTYRAIFDAARDGIVILDERGDFIHANSAASELTGYSLDELLTLNASDLAVVDNELEYARGWKAFLEAGTLQGNYQLRKRDGSVICAEYRAIANFMPGRHLGIIRDVTDAVRTAERIRASEERYRLMIEQAPIAIMIFAPDGSPISVNPAWESMWASPASELEGYNPLEDPQLERKGVTPYLRRAFAGEAQVSPAVQYDPAEIGKQGRPRWAIAHITPLKGPDGVTQEVMLRLLDVTELKEAEERLERLNAELERRVHERTAELEAANSELEGFTFTVSHDLRAPLRAMMGAAMTLLEEYGESLTQPMRAELQRIAGSASKLAQLIDELLKLSRLSRQELVKSDLDLSAMAADVIGQLTGPCGCSRDRFTVQPGLSARGDERLVRLVLQNLIDNACKFSPSGGRVLIGCEDRTFFVKDEGIGFDPQFTNKLFLPFERLVRESDFPGTGIGLANVKRIVERHGGRVWAEGSPGRGATFYFTLQPDR